MEAIAGRDKAENVGRDIGMMEWDALPVMNRQPAKALDEALEGIGARYGARTTDFVAVQLEYPTEPRRALCRSANAFEQTAMTRPPR